MERSTESIMDPFSEMVGLAIFQLKRDCIDDRLPKQIEELGFKITTIDEIDMMVTIKNPSYSTMTTFLNNVKRSETSESNSLDKVGFDNNGKFTQRNGNNAPDSIREMDTKYVEGETPKQYTQTSLEKDERNLKSSGEAILGTNAENVKSFENRSQTLEVDVDEDSVGGNRIDNARSDQRLTNQRMPLLNTDEAQNRERRTLSQDPEEVLNTKVKLRSKKNDNECSFEVIQLTNAIFQEVKHKFKDLIGLYSVGLSKSGENLVTVNVRKSRDYDELMKYVDEQQPRSKAPKQFSVESNASGNGQSNLDMPGERSSVADREEIKSCHLPLDMKNAYFLDRGNESDMVGKIKCRSFYLHIQQKDITQVSVDVIVCPTNNMHVGLPKMIYEYAVIDLQTVCRKFSTQMSSMKVSDVFISPSGYLNAEEVFHTIGPHFDTADKLKFGQDLRKTILACLMLADLRGFKTIAFPFIGAFASEYLERDCFNNYILAVLCFDLFCVQRQKKKILENVIFIDRKPSLVSRFFKFLQQSGKQLAALSTTPDHHDLCFLKEVENDKGHTSLKAKTDCAGFFSELTKIRNPSEVSGCSSIKRPEMLTGNQPDGMMTVILIPLSLAGYENIKTLMISYQFEQGVQGNEHTNPGMPFGGCRRVAYLPDTAEGLSLICRLGLAFLRRLTFTIKKSVTRGRDNSIVWNGIPHKTSLKQLAGSYSYPDPEYLGRLDKNLTDRGVALDNMTKEESIQIQDFQSTCVLILRKFETT